MKIIWLEDEPETIEVILGVILDECKKIKESDIVVCQSFASFGDELENIDNPKECIIIIDIRMNANNEAKFTCNNQEIKVTNKLNSGFEYYNYCIKSNIKFRDSTIIFYSSKPLSSIKEDAKEHNIDTKLIVTKENSLELLNRVKKSIQGG